MKILQAIGACAMALLTAGSVMANDTYPNQVIKVIVPYQPGTSPDSNMRFMGQQLSEILKQPVIIENKGGAGGLIGADAVAKAKPDGYTLGYLSNQHLVHPYMVKKMPYDHLNAFRSVSMLGQSAQVLLISPNFKVNNLAEFIQAAKARKEPVMFGSGGIGSPAHLAGQLFGKQAGLTTTHVPYKGSPESINALLSGEIDYIVTTSATAAPLVRANRVKAVALTSEKRLDAYPGLPTLAESLPNGLVYEPWSIIVVPAGTPQPVIDKLNQAFTQILKSKRTIDYFDSFGSQIIIRTPKEADEFYRSEAKRLATWLKDFDLRLD